MEFKIFRVNTNDDKLQVYFTNITVRKLTKSVLTKGTLRHELQ